MVWSHIICWPLAKPDVLHVIENGDSPSPTKNLAFVARFNVPFVKYFLSVYIFFCYKIQIFNLLGDLTVTFLFIEVSKDTDGLLLLALHVNEVMFKNVVSVNWKSTCNILVHKLFTSQVPVVLLFSPFPNGIKVFESYKDKSTSGFELTAVHTIWYVVLFEVTKFIVWLLRIVEPSNSNFNSGMTIKKTFFKINIIWFFLLVYNKLSNDRWWQHYFS